MKKRIYLLVAWFIISYNIFPQDLLKIQSIDSVVAGNETKTSTIFQKIEKNKIESLHGRNPDKALTIYRFSETNSLLSATSAAYSIGDTEIIVNLYFDSGELIKAKTIYFDINKKRNEYNYYYYSNQLINKEVETSGIHRSDFYIKWSIRLLKELKKSVLNFLYKISADPFHISTSST